MLLKGYLFGKFYASKHTWATRYYPATGKEEEYLK